MRVLVVKKTSIIITVLVIIYVIIAQITSFYQAYRIMFAIMSLFVPGLVLSYLVLPQASAFSKENNIETIERILLSFAFSLSIIPLLIYSANLMGTGFNLVNSSLIIIIFTAIITIILFIKKNKKKI